MEKPEWKKVKADVESMATNLQKYATYLRLQAEKVVSNHDKAIPVRTYL